MGRKKGNKMLMNTLMIFAGVGALTWGTAEFFNFNIVESLSDIVGSWFSMVAYGLSGVGGAMSLWNMFSKR